MPIKLSYRYCLWIMGLFPLIWFAAAPSFATQGKKTSRNAKAALQALFEEEVQNTFSSDAQKEQLSEDGFQSFVPFDWQAIPKTSAHKEHNQQRVFQIVIDAGHGGKDTGAKGQRGTEEKAVVLAIAKRLANEINHIPNFHAILTRDQDVFVPLRDRLNIARDGNADLFVAIHADAYFDKHAKGASVYALSQHGATSEAARWLSNQDNYAELDGVVLNSLQDKSAILRYVLIDLAQTHTIRDSIRLGNKVLDALEEISPLHHKHVDQAPFVVLKSPDIPSILVEIGFISNPSEEKRITNTAFQEKIAQALLVGITRYVKRSFYRRTY